MRARFALAASIAAAALVGVELIAQTTTAPPAQTPPMTSVLAGRKLQPPIRGEAALEWVDPKPERKGDMVITRMTVKNAAAAPIARLTINETWYDNSTPRKIVTGDQQKVKRLINPGEVVEVTMKSPYKAGIALSQYVFTHANGKVDAKAVKKFTE